MVRSADSSTSAGHQGPCCFSHSISSSRRVRVVENPVRIAVEGGDVARALVREAPDGDAADAVGPFRILVLPGDVVAGAGRQHLDVVLRREPLGDQPAVVLRAAEHLGAVALNDEGESHDKANRGPRVEIAEDPRVAEVLSRRRCPAITPVRKSSSKTSAPASSAACSRSFGANCTPAPPSVSGTAAAA